ncbi:NADP-dependent oxidoreductase [Actinomycetospora cinnamomea]|uniref:NADPH:quinone reductase-like Zn-dependent oxidoreductase n=1 Tax=Actinomycetospora cinnamomea TaxID=663609 RepID=A0A2U1EYC1_9PSEU|nr:NADP-dependent oxidoreductase [Actinomycetospora cinnamomea]PVZ04934.1 NADPH:quinone reductase-like Zn-dependent oxidoreductase [Actinomycetospora cinnamomea]
MRAFGFLGVGGPAQQAFLDVPVPEPGPGRLLVQVRAAGVNPGDIRMRRGEYDVTGPAVLGREVAGTVVAAGEGVTAFAPGDEVFGGCPGMVGGWAEQALVTASFAAHRPAAVSPEDAAALPVAAGTAYDALEALALPAGATLLVNGAGGGVGLPTVQLARARGLRVVGTAGAAKQDLLAGLGVVPVVGGDGVAARVREAAPDGVDGVFDLVGGEALRAVAGLAPPGRLFSVADKSLVAELGGRDVPRDRSTAVLDALAARVAAGGLDPWVRTVVPFARAADAVARVEDGHALGKVVIVLDAP